MERWRDDACTCYRPISKLGGINRSAILPFPATTPPVIGNLPKSERHVEQSMGLLLMDLWFRFQRHLEHDRVYTFRYRFASHPKPRTSVNFLLIHSDAELSHKFLVFIRKQVSTKCNLPILVAGIEPIGSNYSKDRNLFFQSLWW